MAADRGALSCWVCSTECLGYRKLKKHYKKKHQEYDLIHCLFCKFVTVCQSDMRKHKKQEHAKDRFTCNLCLFSTRSWNKWKQHEVASHPREDNPDATADPEETSSCQRHRASRHVDNDSLVGLSPEKHEQGQITDPKHEQGQITDTEHDILSAHKVTSVPLLELDSSNTTHLDIALNDSTFQDDSKLASPTDLTAYSSESTTQGFGVQELKCPQCATARQHTELEADSCSCCGFSRQHSHSLLFQRDRSPSQGDNRTHKSLYVCELCKKQFVKKINLTYHMRTHTNDRRYQCKYCDYTSCQKTTLEQHLRGHLGIKPYKCEHCEYSTAYKSNLVFHAVTHSIDRPFSCNFCKKDFKRKDHLSIHMKPSFVYMEVSLEQGEDFQQSFSDCPRNKGHNKFVPAAEFTLNSLPERYRDPALFHFTKVLAELTVRLLVMHTSTDRLKARTRYPGTSLVGTTCLQAGSGWVQSVTVYKESDREPCPCLGCQSSNNPRLQWARIAIATANHVVFNAEEANSTKIDFCLSKDVEDSDQAFKTQLNGYNIWHSNISEDKSWIFCSTHDMELWGKLNQLIARRDELHPQIKQKYSRREDAGLRIVISHPHGCPKHISMSEWASKELNIDSPWWAQATYRPITCPGSSGAPVLSLGKNEIEPWRLRCQP